MASVSKQLTCPRCEQVMAAAVWMAKWRRDFIRAQCVQRDRFYDIKCPGGHYTLKTAPEITRAICRAAGDRVSLA